MYIYMQNMSMELCSSHKVCINNNKESSHVDNIIAMCMCVLRNACDSVVPFD